GVPGPRCRAAVAGRDAPAARSDDHRIALRAARRPRAHTSGSGRASRPHEGARAAAGEAVAPAAAAAGPARAAARLGQLTPRRRVHSQPEGYKVKTASITEKGSLPMGIALLILLLALLIGGVGLAVEALRWLLIIAVVLLIVGALTGWRGRGRAPV